MRTNITISAANSTTAAGADLVGNAAAALAAASIVWESVNSTYAAEALIAAKDLYTFAQTVSGCCNNMAAWTIVLSLTMQPCLRHSAIVRCPACRHGVQ